MSTLIFLYIVILNNGSTLHYRYQFPTMEACERAIAKSRQLPLPGGRGDSNGVVMFCAGDKAFGTNTYGQWFPRKEVEAKP